MTIKLFLDVDGVLNALDRTRQTWPDQTISYAYSQGSKWPIHASKQCGAALSALETDFGVEIVWLTTWMYDANAQIGPIVGFRGGLAVEGGAQKTNAGSDGMTYGYRNWKWEFIQNYTTYSEDPFIWVDDEAIPNYDNSHTAEKWFEEADASDRVHLVRTDARVGLTPANIEGIRDFVSNIQAAGISGGTGEPEGSMDV